MLKQAGRLPEALSAYDQAIALDGRYAEAYVNRGNVLQALRDDEAAVSSYDRAIELNPTYAEAFQARGSCLHALQRFEAAIASFEQAFALNPNYKYLLGMRQHAKMYICDWSNWSSDLQQMAAEIRNRKAICTPFIALSLYDEPALQHTVAQVWTEDQFPADRSLGPIAEHTKRNKVRIGYFSSDFRSHPIAMLTAELFEIHDRSRFEILAFAFGPQTTDAMRTRLEAAFDRFIDVRDRTDIEVAQLARELEIDIAVDLNGFTEHCRTRIFALRAAPIQVSYLGFLGTMGAPYMDYLLADATLIPSADRIHYTEKIVYLPAYQANDSRRSVPERVFTRVELGLPPKGFVFACFNSNYKITPVTFALWMRILKRVPGSVLYIYADNKTVERNLRGYTEQHGVAPQRLIFGARLSP